jgi:hypothetical protein
VSALLESLNRLTKWRSVFAAWQLGTRDSEDAECRAVKDHREVTIILRAEVTALTAILIEKGLVSQGEWEATVKREADLLSKEYEQRFPGMEATEHGIAYDLSRARETMKGWPA